MPRKKILAYLKSTRYCDGDVKALGGMSSENVVGEFGANSDRRVSLLSKLSGVSVVLG